MTTTMETPPPTTAWVGWYRLTERLPWQRACTAATLAECSRLLSDAMRGARFKRANTIMTTGARRACRPTRCPRRPEDDQP